MTNFNLDPDSLSTLVQKAILDSITPEARNKLVTDAIAELLAVQPKDHYGLGGKSKLMEAFDSAIHIAARQLVTEQIKNDPQVQAQIQDLVSAPIAAICDGNYDGLPEKIGAAIGDGVAEWLRQRA